MRLVLVTAVAGNHGADKHFRRADTKPERIKRLWLLVLVVDAERECPLGLKVDMLIPFPC